MTRDDLVKAVTTALEKMPAGDLDFLLDVDDREEVKGDLGNKKVSINVYASPQGHTDVYVNVWPFSSGWSHRVSVGDDWSVVHNRRKTGGITLDPYEQAVLDTVRENPPEIDVYDLMAATRKAGRPLHSGSDFRTRNEVIYNRLIEVGLLRRGERMGTLALTDAGRKL